MEIVLRHCHQYVSEAGVELHETEVGLSSLENAAAGLLAVALAGGVQMNSYDVDRLFERFKVEGKVNIAASVGILKSPVRRRIDFDALATRAPELASLSISAAADQLDFQWQEVTGEDILAMVDQYGGVALVERDPETGVIDSINASFIDYETEEMQEVLESLQASATPKKLVGDLAQTTITTNGNEEQIISLAEWSISWKRKTVDATTTDDALYESSLGSSKSWTAKSKYMFVDGDQSQVDGVLSAIDTTALNPLVWNFFPTVEVGRAAFSGSAFIDGIDIGSGSGKIVGLDVSLKGTGPLNRLVQLAPVANTNTVTGITGQV